MMPTTTSGQRRNQVPGVHPSAEPAKALVIWIAFLFITTCGVAKAQEALPGTAPFHIALSSGTFVEVNPNDAQAAVMAWAKTILQQRGIVTEVEKADRLRQDRSPGEKQRLSQVNDNVKN
jgi:hypothetical protein